LLLEWDPSPGIALSDVSVTINGTAVSPEPNEHAIPSGATVLFNYTGSSSGVSIAVDFLATSGGQPVRYDIFVTGSGGGGGGSTSAGSSSGPAPAMQQFGKPDSMTCDEAQPEGLNWSGVPSGGWGESWAQWMNDGNGGTVCTRELAYRAGSWVIN
jgi:hypothetical protein